MLGLLPIGYLLDKFPLRKVLFLSLLGTMLGGFLLFMSYDLYLQWVARFMCGFFGGTFAFLGGIRIIAHIYPKRFTYFMSIFISFGMVGSMLSQYPLLICVHHFGIIGTMQAMFGCGLIVMIVNVFFFHPPSIPARQVVHRESCIKMSKDIVFNLRNLCDVLLIGFLNMPDSVIGTLWGLVLLMNLFHFTQVTSSLIVTSMYVGLVIGLPLWGSISDKRNSPTWIVLLGAFFSFFKYDCVANFTW